MIIRLWIEFLELARKIYREQNIGVMALGRMENSRKKFWGRGFGNRYAQTTMNERSEMFKDWVSEIRGLGQSLCT